MPFNFKKTKAAGVRKKITHRLIAVSILVVIIASAFIIESRYLPPVAINQLAELTNTRVKADSVNFSPNGSVLIRGLHIKPAEQLPYDNTILRALQLLILEEQILMNIPRPWSPPSLRCHSAAILDPQ